MHGFGLVCVHAPLSVQALLIPSFPVVRNRISVLGKSYSYRKVGGFRRLSLMGVGNRKEKDEGFVRADPC